MSANRRYRSLWPSWTANHPTPPLLSISSREKLIAITKALQTVHDIIREEVTRDRKVCEDRLQEENPIFFTRTQSYFEEGDLAVLDKAKNLGILAIASEPFSSHLQLALLDVSYIPVWREAIKSMLDYQGQHYSHLSWKIAKQQAFDILEQRDLVAELFDDVEDELRSRTIDVRNGILKKIKVLERFTAIYDAQPAPTTLEHHPEPEPHYQLYPLEVRIKKKRMVEAYPQMKQSHESPTLIAIVSMVTLAVAIVPLAYAWQLPSNTKTKGSTDDVDFYLLIQNSAMTILGIFTATYPTFWQEASLARRWAWGLAILGCLCAFAAVALYLCFPTMWSAVASFSGAAIQVYMVFQLAIAGHVIKLSANSSQ